MVSVDQLDSKFSFIGYSKISILDKLYKFRPILINVLNVQLFLKIMLY